MTYTFYLIYCILHLFAITTVPRFIIVWIFVMLGVQVAPQFIDLDFCFWCGFLLL